MAMAAPALAQEEATFTRARREMVERQLMARDITERRRMEEQLGLTKPVITQFMIWLGHVMQGDLGYSFYLNRPVTELIAQRIEPTLALAALTMLITVVVAIPLGTLAAWRHGGWLDRLLMGFSTAGFSIPVFVLACILIWFVSLKLGWFPVQGYKRLADGFWPICATVVVWTFGEMILLPAQQPHALRAVTRYKMILTMIRS